MCSLRRMGLYIALFAFRALARLIEVILLLGPLDAFVIMLFIAALFLWLRILSGVGE